MAEPRPASGTEPRLLLGCYNALFGAVLVLGVPFWLWHLLTRKRWRAGLRQRLGGLPPAVLDATGPPAAVWIHAVSVGEVLGAATLLERLQPMLPADESVLISTTTEAGQRLALERFPSASVFYLPIDVRRLLRPIFAARTPRLLVLMESELWPNLLAEARRAGCAVAVANARISDRSFPRYLRLRRLWRPLLRLVSVFLAQGLETADRLLQLGVEPERVRVTGNLKYDLKPARRTDASRALAGLLAEGGPLLLAGSTLAGEETLLLDAWSEIRRAHPGARLLLAPRQPARFDAVEGLVRRCGYPVARYTDGWPAATPNDAVLLLDTIGDLAGLYAQATLAFVGGSLVEAGGHNPLEAARFGVPVVIGSSFSNFREIVNSMRRADAIEILPSGISEGELARRLSAMLGDSDRLAVLGQNGASLVARESGAADRTAAALASLLPTRVELPA